MLLAAPQHTSDIVKFYGSLHDVFNAKIRKAEYTLICAYYFTATLIPHLHHSKAAVLLTFVGFGFIYFSSYAWVVHPAVHVSAEPSLNLFAVWRNSSA